MADYFQHWFNIGSAADNVNNINNNNNNDSNDDNAAIKASKLPKIFYVNWFRCGSDGKYLWPGFGENSRVLKWIFERTSGTKEAIETPIGFIPKPEDFDLPLGVTEDAMKELFKINIDEWKVDVESITQFMNQFGDNLPSQMREQIQNLKNRLDIA